MLTLKEILKATRQMTSYGERGTAGALDHLPARVQGQRDRRRSDAAESGPNDYVPARKWDDELKLFVD
jgi:hypothetical protein